MGASVVQLSDANGISNGTVVRFNTEHALAPEGQLLMGWRLPRGLRTLVGMSVQQIGWSAIRYRAPSEQPLSDEVMRMVGVSFDANDLFRR